MPPRRDRPPPRRRPDLEELLTSVDGATLEGEPPPAPRRIPPIGFLMWLNMTYFDGPGRFLLATIGGIMGAVCVGVGVVALTEDVLVGLGVVLLGVLVTAATVFPSFASIRELRRAYQDGVPVVGVIVGSVEFELEASTQRRAHYAYRRAGAVHSASFHCEGDVPPTGGPLWILVHPEKPARSVPWPY